MKDWDFYRNMFIAGHMDEIYSLLSRIEAKAMSPIEKIAALHCIYFFELGPAREADIKLQEQIGPYRADIAVYHFPTNLKVVIECDGHDFHEKTKEQAANDKKRDREFQKQGYVVLRYTGSEIVNNPDGIVEDLVKLIRTKRAAK